MNGKVDPKSDIDVINLELVFCDLDQVRLLTSMLHKFTAFVSFEYVIIVPNGIGDTLMSSIIFIVLIWMK